MWPFTRRSKADEEAEVVASEPKDEANDYGTVSTTGGRTFLWEARGQAHSLLITVFLVIANQSLYLLLIAVNVMYSKEYLMSCNPLEVGYPTATMCEWTKSHVRCFPILGLQVSVLVTSRMLLQHRIYYQLLKRGALVDFDNFDPLHDPLFWILVVDLLLAMFHFVILLWDLWGFSFDTMSAKDFTDEKLVEDSSQTAAFYIVPAMVFLSFLYGSYDTEQSLLPLSKYFEEDPHQARKNLAKMPLLPEPKCHYVLDNGFWDRLEAKHPEAAASGGIDEDIVYSAFVKEARDTSKPSDTEQGDEEADAYEPEELSSWRLVSTLWPGKLLLSHRLAGDEAQNFRFSWYVFSAFSVIVLVLTLLWFLEALKEKVIDMRDGQADTDWSGALVVCVHIALWLWLAKSYALNMLSRPLSAFGLRG